MPGEKLWQRLRRLARASPLLASLRTRLILLVLLAILPALGLIIFNALQLRQTGIDTAKESALRVVRSTANQHEHLLEGARQLLLTLSQLRQVQQHDAAACLATFENLRALHPVYSHIGLFNLDGEPVAISSAPTGSFPARLEWLLGQTLTQRQFTTGEYQLSPTAKQAVLPLAYPVAEPNQQPRGVVVASISLDWIPEMISKLELPPNFSLTVFDRHRMTLLRYPDDRFVGQVLPTSRPTEAPPALSMDEGVRPIKSRDGTWRLYAFSVLGRDTTSPALMSVGIPLAAAYAPANRMLFRNLIFLGIVAGLAITAAWVGGQVLVLRRIRPLLKATSRLAEGDLTARTNLSPSAGELGQLAHAFDSMAAALEARVAERRQAEAQLKSLNEELEARVNERTLELQRSNQDLDQFAAVASHDLQEPLRMVTSYLQLLEQRYASGLDSKAREFIGFAVDGASRMQQLIRDLLTYSRVSTQPHPFEKVNCEEVLAKALSNLQLAIRESAAQITHVPLPTVPGNPLLLTQLFQNLISNALKFRGTQPPRIQINAIRETSYWHFTVADNGIGIAPENFERIFALFHRLHSREAYPGTGIGLAVCKKIVERHNGRIWVQSTPGQGTTFHFTVADHASLA